MHRPYIIQKMKQYYYANENQQLGPFSFQELRSKNIQKDTYVWYEGLTDWTRAGELSELSTLFQAPPAPRPSNRPPIQERQTPRTQQQQQQYQQRRNDRGQNRGEYQQQYNQAAGIRPKTWLVESILVTVLCSNPIGIAAIVFAAQVDSKYNRGDQQGAEQASKNAKLFTYIALGISVFFLFIFLVLGG